MTAARALLAAGCLLGGACAGLGKSVSDGMSQGTGGGGSSGTTVCQVNIVPITPSSFNGLVAAPGATLRVQGQVAGVPPASFSWQWQVTTADGAPVPTTTVGGVHALIEFPVSAPGTYTIAVSLASSGTSCAGSSTVLVARPGAWSALFRARFTPPPGAEPVQEREIQILGGTPSGGNVITLDVGLAFPADTRDAQSEPLAAYVRLTDPTGRLIVEAHRTADAPPPLLHLTEGPYAVLVVPDGDVAPLLLPQRGAADLASAFPMALSQGERVTGTVREGATPVAGATVVLRAGALPSTIATTGGDGAFTLHAASGLYAATVIRPLALQMQAGGTAAAVAMTGKLEATLPASTGVPVVSHSGAAISVDVGTVGTAALSLSLGTTVTAGTRVVLESAPIPGLVTFWVGGDARPVDAAVRGEMAPGSDGTLAVTGLPRAHYHGKVVPGAGMSAAITPIADLDLTGVTPPPQTVVLLPKVSITGNLIPSKQAGGVALTAIDTTGDVESAIAGVTDAQGGFTLAVSPNRTYALRARPTADRALAQAVFGPLAVGAAGLQLQNGQMPPALLFAGRVLDHGAVNGSPATLIQIFCEASLPGCTDSDTPIAETVTAANGAFALRLPDPGVN